jgi:hypothetical protein
MTRLFLHLACVNFPHCPIWITDGATSHGSKGAGCIVRSSPIYSIGECRNLDPIDDQRTFVWLGFTVNPFACIAKLKREAPQTIPNLFTSHGLASLVLLSTDLAASTEVRGLIGERLIGEESWIVEAGKIANATYELSACPEFLEPNLYLADHGSEDHAIFRDVRGALCNVAPQLQRLSEEHAEMARSVVTLSQLLSINVLFLHNRIEENEYGRRCAEIVNGDTVFVGESIAQINESKSDPHRTIVALHQYRDEAIQVAAVLQSVFQQCVAGIPPIAHSSHQAGTFSLLGVGGAFASLLALYSHVRKAFITVQPERIVRESFPAWKAPPLPSNPNEYEQWRSSLKDYSKPKSTPPSYSPVQSIFHLLYFSNRLGFRATKLSITAAFQSICLGAMPSWNVSTIFHEFLHAHVKALLGELFPLEDSTFDAAYELYRCRRAEPGRAAHLKPFIQALILHVVSALHSVSRDTTRPDPEIEIADCLNPRVLRQELLRHHDQIDELFVHVLDLNYFYDSDIEVYIRSIWSSWLTLPFITKRISEYALRTICAIASIDDGRQIERFNRGLNNLKTQLEKLRKYDFTDQALLSEVLNFLHDEANIRVLRNKFFIMITLGDVVAEFLVFPTLQPQLFREIADSLQNDETYSYDLSTGEYPVDPIESCVKFLMGQLKQTLNEWEAGVPSERSEFATLWSFQKIASTLTPKKYSYERQRQSGK